MHARKQPFGMPRLAARSFALAALGTALLLAGCADEEDFRAVIDETEAFCAAHPVPAFPASVTASSVYVGAGALTRSWSYWIPERLLQKGFAEVESAASIAPYIAGSGEYLRFRIAEASDAGCAGQRALAAALAPQDWERTHRHMVELGLRADQCLAIERTAQRRSPYWLEAWDVSASLSDLHAGLPIERKRVRFVLTQARDRRVLHEHFAEYGFVNVSMSVPFGCRRHPEWNRFSDGIVLGAGGATVAAAAGPEMIEQPPAYPVGKTEPQVESSRDLGGVPIDGMELSQRRARSRASHVEGFEILEGESTDPHETNPGWPRYLQMTLGGTYRRVRLAWLEGDPHGLHDRPVRLFDLGDRIGLLAVTRRISPATRGAFDLSWAELARDTGLPLRRVEGVVPVDADAEVAFQSLIEAVQPSGDGLRFTLTEVGVQRDRGLDSHFVLLRETRYRWNFE